MKIATQSPNHADGLLDQLTGREDQLCRIMATVVLDRLGMNPAPTPVFKRCMEDFQHHLEYLDTALRENSVDLFAGYILWVQEVLQGLNVPQNCLPIALNVLSGTLLQALPVELGRRATKTCEDALLSLAMHNPGAPLAFEAYCDPKRADSAFTNNLLNGDFSAAVGAIEQQVQYGSAYVDVAVDTIQPGMYRVGQLWQTGEITVAKEHLATATCHRAMATAVGCAPRAERIGRKALFACIPGSIHGLGLLTVSDAFDLAGWQSMYLGANTPTEAIIAQASDLRPEVLGLSVSVPSDIGVLREVIAAVKGDLAGSAPEIVVGGVALNWNADIARALGAHWFQDARTAVAGCTPSSQTLAVN